MNAVNQPESVLLLGGTSEIGLAIVRALPRERLRRVVLAGRTGVRLDSAEQALKDDLNGVVVEQASFDASQPQTHAQSLGEIFASGDVDVMILAFGVLGDQQAINEDPSLALPVIETNYVGGASALLRTAELMIGQGHGNIVVLSSVAADRARADNFVYGSSKAGLDAMAQGLGDALADTGVSVLVVRPGFVRTRMTDGMAEAPFATEPNEVAQVTVNAMRHGKSVVYAPHVLRAVMGGLKALPRPVFRRVAKR